MADWICLGPVESVTLRLCGARSSASGQAAAQGHGDAQLDLSRMYFVGEGVPQDYEAAVRWVGQAAEQGHGYAQCVLGLMYSEGAAVSPDYVAAHMWPNLAASRLSNGDRELAVHARDDVAASMSRDTVQEAQRLAPEW